MNILLLTMVKIADINEKGIYTDLMRKFRDEGYEVFIVCPCERRDGKSTSILELEGVHILRVKTLNLQKTTSVFEKGIGQILLEYQFKLAMKKYFNNINFNVILYSTPPITFTNLIKFVKEKSNGMTYLLLKDIFPQNAIDLGMLKKTGLKGLLYTLFRKKERDLYRISDYIGCMSPANVEFVINNNKDIVDKSKIEIAPNSIELKPTVNIDRLAIRKKYNLPIETPVFIYGGNLGKPQGIDFIIECLNRNLNRNDCFFLIVGSGTEYDKLQDWFITKKPCNMALHSKLPKSDYDILVRSCDVGLIFLDYRFLIPNFPSRLLSYLEYKMPVLISSDPNCDMGKIAEQNLFGKYCPSNDVDAFTRCVNDYVLNKDSLRSRGVNGYNYLCNNYLVDNTYNAIISHIN